MCVPMARVAMLGATQLPRPTSSAIGPGPRFDHASDHAAGRAAVLGTDGRASPDAGPFGGLRLGLVLTNATCPGGQRRSQQPASPEFTKAAASCTQRRDAVVEEEEGAMSTTPPGSGPLLTVRAALVLLMASVVGLVAGGLAYLTDHDVPAAVLVGAAAAGGALLLGSSLDQVGLARRGELTGGRSFR